MKKKIFLLIIMIILISLYLFYKLTSSYEISINYIPCDIDKLDINTESNVACRKFMNKLGNQKGVFIEINDDLSFIVSDDYYDYYEVYYKFDKTSKINTQISEYDLEINYYENYSWDGEGEVATDNLITIYSSYHLNTKNTHIMGLGPNVTFNVEGNKEEIKKNIKDKIIEMLLEVIK